jgi:transmembrane sensor
MSDARHIEEQAAEWLVRSEQPDWSEEQDARLREWLDESYSHKAAFWRLDHGWRKADRLAALGGGAAILARRVPPFVNWRRAAIAASIALMIALVPSYFIATRGIGDAGSEQMAEQRFATALGARKTVALADGSRVELNTATLGRALVNDRRREFWLDHGEAYFDIVHDASRPFVIYAGPRTVTVLGTKFTVRRDGDRVTVSVIQGRVKVDVGPAHAAGPSTTIGVGDTAVAEGHSTIVASRSLEQVERAMSWRQGMLTFDNATLADAAVEFNRYNWRKIEILDERAAEMRIGGTFEANNVDAFARLLRDAYGVKVEVGPAAVKISA